MTEEPKLYADHNKYQKPSAYRNYNAPLQKGFLRLPIN